MENFSWYFNFLAVNDVNPKRDPASVITYV